MSADSPGPRPEAAQPRTCAYWTSEGYWYDPPRACGKCAECRAAARPEAAGEPTPIVVWGDKGEESGGYAAAAPAEPLSEEEQACNRLAALCEVADASDQGPHMFDLATLWA